MAEVDCWTKGRDEDVARCSQETQFICERSSVEVTRDVHWEGFFTFPRKSLSNLGYVASNYILLQIIVCLNKPIGYCRYKLPSQVASQH